jgi:DNA polymerase-3 subunit epsilon
MTTFVALDFETADRGRDSACALGIVRVEQGQVVNRFYTLIRPPRREFEFTDIHGITWTDVKNEPNFEDLWPLLAEQLDGAEFFAAHNASFDQGVLYACCDRYSLPRPPQAFVCTVKLARQTWQLYPTKLPNVCHYLGITLDHHQALSDAEACAKIVIAAHQEVPPSPSGNRNPAKGTPRRSTSRITPRRPSQ